MDGVDWTYRRAAGAKVARKVMKKLIQERWNAIMWGWPRLKICVIRAKQWMSGDSKPYCSSP